jgi:hypothetical protein
MDTTAIINIIKQLPEVTELLARVCDFELADPVIVEPWFRLQSGQRPNVVAQDAAGGLFALCPAPDTRTQPVLFVTSEGEAGIIAHDLAAALQLMIQLPYWRDCLKFSGGGQLDEMQKAIPYLEQELRQDEPDIDTHRETLLRTLQLAHPKAPVETLYQAMTSTSVNCLVIGEDGSALRSLFNTFVVTDNPLWRTTGTDAP